MVAHRSSFRNLRRCIPSLLHPIFRPALIEEQEVSEIPPLVIMYERGTIRFLEAHSCDHWLRVLTQRRLLLQHHNLFIDNIGDVNDPAAATIRVIDLPVCLFVCFSCSKFYLMF